MGKTVRYLKTYRGLLEELARVQREKDVADTEGNEMLARLFELDTIRIRERLKIVPCDICEHGGTSHLPITCQFWNQCRSIVKLEKYWEEEDWVLGDFNLVFILDKNIAN